MTQPTEASRTARSATRLLGASMKHAVPACALAVSMQAAPVFAQDGSNLPQLQRELEEVNNGTNPTLLTTQTGLQYQFNKINPNLDTGLMEAFYTQPFGDGTRAFRFTVPWSDSEFNANPFFGDATASNAANPDVGSEFALGDISMTYIDVFHLTEKNGAAYTVELFLDTAKTDFAGYGQLAAETSLFYAWFREDGSIFAPAWVQTFGLEGGNDQGEDVNVTTVDFYYVPKLPNPRYFLTFDPAIIHDWEKGDTFGSLQVTAGMMTGRLFGGDSQVFIKPGVLIGGEAPADWSVQVGFKILNF
ncbi:hypothetical protein [Oceanomicrobium pacificus]|uniref:MetA-pathway of phenol degradation n=1 Tax=Oceanomicrobium pacificus TaxID=2692916 RepID=A0A6B0TKY6_9RHOB|nr:hypothetical protein [Oceanomicrobium pacificus]MXU64526.1 hypothetical protein [Oceanomicrobium pacificus]